MASFGIRDFNEAFKVGDLLPTGTSPAKVVLPAGTLGAAAFTLSPLFPLGGATVTLRSRAESEVVRVPKPRMGAILSKPAESWETGQRVSLGALCSREGL